MAKREDDFFSLNNMVSCTEKIDENAFIHFLKNILYTILFIIFVIKFGRKFTIYIKH